MERAWSPVANVRLAWFDLYLTGYRNLKRVAGSPHALHGSAWIDVDRTNAARFPF